MLEIINWKEFEIKDIFPKIKTPKFNNKPVENGSYPFVSSSSVNNGVSLFSNEVSFEGNCITVSTNGNCFDCFYHQGKIAISSDVEILTNKYLNEYNGLFVCVILNKESFKWNYGRKPKNDKVFETKIKLPANGSQPDWDYMAEYIKNIQTKDEGKGPLSNSLLTNNKALKGPFEEKPISEWEDFIVSDVFNPFISGIGLTEQEIKDNPGDFPAVQSGSENNACMGFIDLEYCKQKKYKYIQKQCLTVARSGSAGFVSYQENGCVVGDSAKILTLKYENANKYHYLFLRTILMANYYKFAYGRKVRIEQYENMHILLPAKDKKPDWDYIEKYMKSLPFSDKI